MNNSEKENIEGDIRRGYLVFCDCNSRECGNRTKLFAVLQVALNFQDPVISLSMMADFMKGRTDVGKEIRVLVS